MSSTGRVALGYVEFGWPVIPLWWPHGSLCACPRGGQCGSPGKHPLLEHGLHDASTDPAQVTAWWRRWPRANVGLATGIVFDVLDLDSAEATDWLDNEAPDWRGSGPLALTGKGQHRYYATSGLGNRTRIAGVSGLDYRGRGGYVVAPPSRHVNGHRYVWTVAPDTPVEPMPVVLADVVNPPPPPRTPRRIDAPAGGWSPAGLVRLMASAVEGNRNASLYWSARRVREDLNAGRVSPTAAADALDQLDATARAVGLTDREVAQTIRSAMRGTP